MTGSSRGLEAAFRVTVFATAVAAGLVSATGARAVEALDGRLQLHGFVEMQVRALNEKFSQELDLAQWYNVVNLEFEADLAPDGIGPFDLLQAYVRIEGRYDAIYSQGFGMFPSIDTYGDFSNRLPERLRDARDVEYGGTQPATTWKAGENRRVWPRISDKRPAQLGPDCDTTTGPCHPGEREGFPGFDTFFRQAGHDDRLGDTTDGVVGAKYNGKASRDSGQQIESEAHIFGVPERTTDDPARYANQHVLDFAFALKDFRGPASSAASTQILGPWLPKNFITAIALNRDVANPFRGRSSPNLLYDRVEPPSFSPSSMEANYDGIRFYEGLRTNNTLPAVNERADRTLQAALDSGFMPTRIDRRDKFIEFIQTSSSTVRSDRTENVADPNFFFFFNNLVRDSFGGDFSGVVPCVDPGPGRGGAFARAVRNSDRGDLPNPRQRCTVGGYEFGDEPGTYQEGLVARLSGGEGENPFRPAPDVASLGADLAEAARRAGVPVDAVAQGSYLPSRGLQQEIARGDLDSLNFNFDQVERSFNRGASQQRTKEIKEAYLDVEMLDSRLWMRLGLQNIVWGKTELFRTTDQFNPQDLALASLPSLEESRIALWSARFVYSLYDVGALEDVRLEVAFNFDKFEPSDLGACGEPYTIDVVCTLTNGIFAHGALGVGVAGIDRPEDPWNDISALEIGGRIEWRWDRFSFALTDFYGYSDLPYTDAIFYYERNVDLDTGRPLVARLIGEPVGKGVCVTAGQIAPDHRHGPTQGDDVLQYNSSYASHPLSMTPGAALVTDRLGGDDVFITSDAGVTPYRGGIGRDPGCLRPGGAPGEPGAFRFDEELLQQTNALYNHHANQQIFAWSCSSTIGIGARLDPGSCAWSIFASPAELQEGLVTASFSEVISIVGAGDQNDQTQTILGVVNFNQKGSDSSFGTLPPVPLKSINSLFNDPTAPFDTNNNGIEDVDGCADENQDMPCDLGGFDGVRTVVDPGLLALDSRSLDGSLTNEQRALLGCGPFWGTRCDTSRGTFGDEQLTLKGSAIYGTYGGVDFLNMEASMLEQSWPGFEGTLPGHVATDRIPQPGTVFFDGGPVCTRVGPSGSLVSLPGCRGIERLEVAFNERNQPSAVLVEFEPGYMPSVDGCVLGSQIRRSQTGLDPRDELVDVVARGASPELRRELALCGQAVTSKPDPRDEIPTLGRPGGCPIGDSLKPSNSVLCDAELVTLEDLPLIHPFAGCIDSPVFDGDCEKWYERDLVDEFLGGEDACGPVGSPLPAGTQCAQLFKNELAAFSWNFLQFLVLSSCSTAARDLDGLTRSGRNNNPSVRDDRECFVAELAHEKGRCSFSTPQYCSNVKGFFSAAGVTRNTVRAGGNGQYGRRTFIWHSGGELTLRYEKRNVLGFSTDFAEDRTKTNWGVEFTWIEGVPFSNNDSEVGVTKSDAINLTVSVDRPTFINFLNPNRTFFFNTQWFFSYLPDYESGFTSNGPINALFTFAAFTGYYQDRVMPNFVTVYDFRSRSGGILPSLQYRFTDSFSVTVGMLYFFGRTQLVDMPVRDFGPTSNRVGENAYKSGTDNLLSLVRKRDEVFLRLRWTF